MAEKRKIRPLTKRQKQALDFVVKECRVKGRPPTLREIGNHLNLGSTNAVRSLLTALERKGFIRRRPYLSRGIELLKTKKSINVEDVVRIPILGRVAAGAPLLAEENLEGNLVLDRSMFRADDGFALKVIGESMTESGIFDGDVVLARPNLPLENGSIVVAIIGDEATVKHYFPETDRVRLEPANPHFGPIIVEKDTPGFRIAGKVVGLYRKF